MKPNREVGKWMATGPATGFTLPELLLTVGLVGIVSAAALPTLAGTVQSYRVRTAAWQVAGDLRLARQKAVSSNHRHRVCFSDCGGAVPAALKLVDTKTSSTGVSIHTYERAGAIQYGSFEVDEHGRTEALWEKE